MAASILTLSHALTLAPNLIHSLSLILTLSLIHILILLNPIPTLPPLQTPPLALPMLLISTITIIIGISIFPLLSALRFARPPSTLFGFLLEPSNMLLVFLKAFVRLPHILIFTCLFILKGQPLWINTFPFQDILLAILKIQTILWDLYLFAPSLMMLMFKAVLERKWKMRSCGIRRRLQCCTV
jgi:hypothetical protein